jgi:serine/threonine-protein kinase
MLRPEAERRFLRLAQQRGYLRLEDAAELVEHLEEKGLFGLHALRDLAIRSRLLHERAAYDLFQQVSRELREVPEGIARIGGYEILERIGRGSMGVVYRAQQVSLEKEVALKVLPPRLSQDPLFVERFLREARAAGRLNHPNVVAALDAGQADGFHYFAMELVSGSSLKEIVEARGPIEEREALKVAFFVAKALRHAHEAGIIHRDVKPANVMVTSDGRVKLTDLGLARKVESEDCSLTQHGKSVGTPYYMSPEQAVEERRVDARCDIYALGCTIYYALTGKPPYDAPTPSAILAKHVSAPIPDPRAVIPAISEPAARLVMHMMAKRPEARPQSARDVVEVLRAILARPDAPPPAASQTLESMPPIGSGLARAAAVARLETAPAPVVARIEAGAAPLALKDSGRHPRAAKPRRPAPQESGVSLMELAPVSSATVRRLRRQQGRRLRPEPRGPGAAVAVAVGAIILAVGALTYALATGGGDRAAEAAGGRGRGGARDEIALAAEARGAAGRPAASGPRRPGSPSLSEEALDREAAERAALEREAARPAIEAAKAGAQAEKLAAAARARDEAAKRRAAEAAARVDDAEAKRHEALLAEVGKQVASGKLDEAVAALGAAVKGYENGPVRARAERDLLAVRAMLDLRGAALEALAAKRGRREALALRTGSTIEGEIAAVAAADGTVTIAIPTGGSFAIRAETIADATIAELVRTALGFHHPRYLVGDGLRIAYAGDLAKGRALVAQAAERGDEEARAFLARIDEIAKGRGIDLARAADAETAAPPVASGGDGREGDPPGTTVAGGESGAGGAAVVLTEQALLRLFESQPVSFTPEGRVRFRYVFLNGQKQLGADFEAAGGEVRWDPSLAVLKLEGDGRRITHRAVFAGDVKVEAELVYMQEPPRGSLLEVFVEDAKARGTSIESIFGIALVDRRKGKIASFAGPVNAPEVACREIKAYVPYQLALGVEGGAATTVLDGAVRGHVDGLGDGAAARRRVGLAFDRVNAQLRSLTIEGRLDLAWVARELARRAGVRAAR